MSNNYWTCEPHGEYIGGNSQCSKCLNERNRASQKPMKNVCGVKCSICGTRCNNEIYCYEEGWESCNFHHIPLDGRRQVWKKSSYHQASCKYYEKEEDKCVLQ